MKLPSAVSAVILLLTRLSVAEVVYHKFKIDKYELTIKPYFLRSDGPKLGQFEAEAEISLQCIRECGTDLFLSSEGLEYNVTEVYHDATGRLLEGSSSVDSKNLNLKIFESFDDYTAYKVRLVFSGRMDTKKGLQMSTFTGPSDIVHHYVWTKMEMSKAQTVFPHFIQPEMRNVFHISIIRPNEYRSYSNAPLGDTEKMTDSHYKDWFKPTSPIPGYMVSIILIKLNGAFINDTLVLSQTYLDVLTVNSRSAFNITKSYYKELFELTEPPRGFLIGIFKLARGTVIQAPGLGFCDEELLTYTIDFRLMAVIDDQTMKAKISSAQALSSLTNANPEFWEHDWVERGLAIYYEYFGTHEMEPVFRMDIQFVTDVMHRAMHAGDLLVNFPMRYNKDLETSYVKSELTSLRNAKAASFIRMIAHVLTVPRFNVIMKDFISQTLYKTYVSTDFFESMIENWPPQPHLENKDAFLDEWFNCYDIPVIEVTLSKDKKSAYLVQKTNITANKQNTFLIIPITYTTNIDRDFINTLPALYMDATGKSVVIDFPKPIEWIIVNIQQVGLYRVLYSREIYKAIGKELMRLGKNNFTEIHQLNRAQLIDDLFSFYIRQYVPSVTIIDFLRYLRNEYDFAPWKAATNGFIYLSSLLDRIDLPLFGQFVLYLSENVYNKLSALPNANDTILDKYLRDIILNSNCRFGDTNLTKFAQNIVKGFIYDYQPIPNDIFATMMCCGMRVKDKVLYFDLFENYPQTKFLKLQRKMMDGFACMATPLAIEEYFNYTLTYGIPVEDKEAHVYKLLRESPDNAFFVLQLILRNMKAFASILQNKPRFAQLMYNIGILLNDEHEWNYWKMLTNKNKDMFAGNSLAITSAYDVQDLHNLWKTYEYPRLKEILRKRKYIKGFGHMTP